MPNYGVSGDVRDLGFSQSTEVEVPGAIITTCLTKATNLVNSYLGHTYPEQVPYTVVGDIPAMINDLTTDLAIYFTKRSKHPGPGPLAEEIKSYYYDKSITMLENLRDKKLMLPEITAKIERDITANQIDFQPTFGIGDELSQSVDSNHLQDEADKRQ